MPVEACVRATHLHLSSMMVIVHKLFQGEIHEKQVESIRNAVGGVLVSASLAIHAVGRGYALLAHTKAKHGIKQVDRLIGNDKLERQDVFPAWVRFVLGARKEILVALDWTEFDKDDQATLSFCLITRHGRATPLLWRTYKKSEMADHRAQWERALISELHALLEPEVKIHVLADRGFGDQTLYSLLQLWGWDFTIRFRSNITVETPDGTVRKASELVQGGRARIFKDVRVTAERTSVPAVVVVHAKGMKDAWCLATTTDGPASDVVKRYGRRFCIEETFRDQKDIHFGMGLSATHVKSPERRDRLLLIGAIAQALLTLLGAAGERIGWDRGLKSNTSKKRQQSLFAQGRYWFTAIGFWPPEKTLPLLEAFDQLLDEHNSSLELLGEI